MTGNAPTLNSTRSAWRASTPSARLVRSGCIEISGREFRPNLYPIESSRTTLGYGAQARLSRAAAPPSTLTSLKNPTPGAGADNNQQGHNSRRLHLPLHLLSTARGSVWRAMRIRTDTDPAFPQCHSHLCAETHRRAQPLRSEARNARNLSKSTIPGIFGTDGSRLELLQPDTTVLHLTAVALQADGAGWRNLEGRFQDFPIAGAESDVVGGDYLNLIPILRFIMLEFLIRTGNEVIAALQLGFTDEDATVGVNAGPKFKPEDEIRRELAGRPNLLNTAAFRRGSHNEAAEPGEVTAFAACGQ